MFKQRTRICLISLSGIDAIRKKQLLALEIRNCIEEEINLCPRKPISPIRNSVLRKLHYPKNKTYLLKKNNTPVTPEIKKQNQLPEIPTNEMDKLLHEYETFENMNNQESSLLQHLP